MISRRKKPRRSNNARHPAGTVSVTFFPNRFATHLAVHPMTYDALELLIRDTSAASKGELPLLKFATFGDKRSTRDCLRFDGNVVAIHGIEADYDDGTMPMTEAAQRLRRAGIEALLYGSPSATVDVHKWRVLCFLAKPIKGVPDVLRDRRRRLVGVLNAVLGGVLAPESFALSQAYYYGRIDNRPAPTVLRVDGVRIDAMRNPPRPVIPAACRIPKRIKQPRTISAAEAMKMDARFAELVRGLEVLGLYRGRRNGVAGWHTIRCPWAHRHTDPNSDEAGIIEPSAENNWRGGFKCFHSHCAGLGMHQFSRFFVRAMTSYYGRRHAA
jgi:hypothetical protein